MSARTASIPTHSISATNFGLSQQDAADLYCRGETAAQAFFGIPRNAPTQLASHR